MSLEWKVGDRVGFVDLEKRKPLPKIEIGSEAWYVMEVFAGHEEYFYDRMGDVVYFPRKVIWKKVRRVRKDGVREREKRSFPLIAGYLFLNAELEHPGVRWMFEDRRMIGVLSFAGQALRVPVRDILRLRIAENLGDYDETRKIFSSIIGTMVEVQSGPFAEKYVMVHSFSDGKFRGSLVGSDLEVQIPLSNIEKIGH
jgi:transcription antitermination factor NusG